MDLNELSPEAYDISKDGEFEIRSHMFVTQLPIILELYCSLEETHIDGNEIGAMAIKLKLWLMLMLMR